MMAFITGPLWLFLKGIPAKVWMVICVVGAALIGIYIVDWRARQQEKKKQRQLQQIETAKEREVVLDTSRKEIDNVEDAKDAAIAAPDSLPEFRDADQLRDEAPAIAEVILRSRGGN